MKPFVDVEVSACTFLAGALAPDGYLRAGVLTSVGLQAQIPPIGEEAQDEDRTGDLHQFSGSMCFSKTYASPSCFEIPVRYLPESLGRVASYPRKVLWSPRRLRCLLGAQSAHG